MVCLVLEFLVYRMIGVLTLPRYSILCSEFAVKAIDQPFIGPEDDKDEWAL